MTFWAALGGFSWRLGGFLTCVEERLEPGAAASDPGACLLSFTPAGHDWPLPVPPFKCASGFSKRGVFFFLFLFRFENLYPLRNISFHDLSPDYLQQRRPPSEYL